LSGPQTIGPDGAITLPVAGTLRVAGMTRDEAAKAVKGALAKFFTNITATVRVDQYVSNRLMVLGRVKTPGIHRFETVPTLLEILSRAGGLSIDAGQMNPTHCAIVRGREGVAWLDLKRMMENGDLTLNLRLKPNDLIFIPEWSEQPIYVLGEVQRPGLFRRTPGMTLLDALALAGGTTRDSDPSEMHLVRPARNQNVVIDLEEILKPNPSMNVALEGGDILYVPTNGLADYGYVMEKLNISSWIFVGTTAVSTRAAAINSRNR
jgi:polysaccharide export outer membrane protein